MIIYNNQKGSALMIVLMIGILIAALAGVSIFVSNNSFDRVNNRKKKSSVFNIAEAGKEHALALLRSGEFIAEPSVVKSVFKDCKFAKGKYSVTCHANKTIDTVKIISIGTLGSESATITIIAIRKRTFASLNPKIESAVTTRSSVTELGNIIIDGRNWSLDGTTLLGDGVYGIKTCGDLTQSGNALVGGNGGAPIKDAGNPIIEIFANKENYPETPEDVLGLPAGSLEKYKTKSLPSMPFTGIVYYECDGKFNSPNFQGSRGVFICHNESRSATISNVDGSFTGVLIADRVDHINSKTTIIGAVVTLSEVEGTNAFGNGNAHIKYSSAVLSNVINPITVAIDSTYDVISWKQN